MKSLNADADISAGFSGAAASHEAIGDIIRRNKRLSEAQVEQVLLYQRKHGLRFGEAAVALKFASQNDVMTALSVQFEYPNYTAEEQISSPELVAATNPFGEQAEIFRDLRSQLLMGVFAPEQRRSALAVVSPNSGDGRSYVAANLAVSLSQLGGNTLLVDADLRSPRLNKLFAADPSAGLSGMLMGRASSDVLQSVKSLPSLYLLQAGVVPPNPLELIQRPAFGLLLHELLTRFDHVVVDSPAASNGSDARVIAAKCGAALVIGRKATTKMKPMRALIGALNKSTANVAGLVLNDR